MTNEAAAAARAERERELSAANEAATEALEKRKQLHRAELAQLDKEHAKVGVGGVVSID